MQTLKRDSQDVSSSTAAGRDQRGAERLHLLMRTAKLVSPDGEYLCILRDASRTGCRARIYHPLPDSGDMALELGSMLRYDVEKVWESETEAGFQFKRGIELSKLVHELGPYPKRSVRLQICLASTIHTLEGNFDATILNMSQQGARIITRRPLAREQRLRLDITGLRTVDAQVRWRDNDAYGLIFDDTFRFDELARLASSLQRSAGRRNVGAPNARADMPMIELP